MRGVPAVRLFSNQILGLRLVGVDVRVELVVGGEGFLDGVVFLLDVDLIEVTDLINVVLEHTDVGWILLLWLLALESRHVVGSSHILFLLKGRWGLALLKVNNLDLEGEGGATWDHVSHTGISVGILRWASNDSLLTLVECRNGFVPTLDDFAFAYNEFKWIFFILIFIENSSIFEGTLVDDLYSGVLWDSLAFGRSESLHFEAEFLCIQFLRLEGKGAVLIFWVVWHCEFTFNVVPNILVVDVSTVQIFIVLNFFNGFDIGIRCSNQFLRLNSLESFSRGGCFETILSSKMSWDVSRTLGTRFARSTLRTRHICLLSLMRFTLGALFSWSSFLTAQILSSNRMTVRVDVGLLHEIFHTITVRIQRKILIALLSFFNTSFYAASF